MKRCNALNIDTRNAPLKANMLQHNLSCINFIGEMTIFNKVLLSLTSRFSTDSACPVTALPCYGPVPNSGFSPP